MTRKRRFTVEVSPAEHARLHDFDNKQEAREPWPLGPKLTFRRKNATTFVVQEHAGAAWDAVLMTSGRARLRADGRVDVVIAVRSVWLGWLLVAGGLVCLALTPRDGVAAAALGVGLVAAGWLLFIRRPGATEDLDAVEHVMREEIRGDWQPADAR